MSCCEHHVCDFPTQEYSELWLSHCHNKAGQEQDVMVLA